MRKSLWVKFLVLLVAVFLIALSAAFFLRELMVRDFRSYIEGEQEDRVSWMTADLESAYEAAGMWLPDTARSDAVWALMLGFDMRLKDADGAVVMDTDTALKSLPQATRQRIEALSSSRRAATGGPFTPYPLFSGDTEVGSLEVRFFAPGREALYIERSNTFLLSAFAILGGIALVLSIIVSGKLTRPLKRITSAAAAISEGDLSKRVEVGTRDELGRLSDAFNRMARTLEMQETLRKKVIANVAHELRTPLAAMQGEIEAMLDGLIPADKDQLQSILEETGRLRKLLDGIEELTQAQASGLSLRKSALPARAFLSGIMERFARAASERGIAMSLECADGVVVHADPDRLSQIVINLLSNAVKAVSGSGSVTVAGGQAGGAFILEVRDTGKGIKASDLPFIFERFYRVSEGGLGLGLAIVRELVTAHGGTIEVRSTEGSGSVFTVRLPG
ncbi:MAG TPA: HAMP domain-containing sensor histidine kinase [Nitrospirota bacterium]|nr:HAMP domain-containing sensor histidine kinase [Nitrospirota bacterium]